MPKPYINIGNETSCFFVTLSKFLIKRLKDNRLVYDAIFEAQDCAKSGHYSIGIIVFFQLLDMLNQKKKSKKERNDVAHRILREKATEKDYRSHLAEFKKAADDMYEYELEKKSDKEAYFNEIISEWKMYRETVLDIS